MTYDAWKLQSAEDAGFYRFDESDDEEDDVERADQCDLESRAYLQRACAELRINELVQIREATKGDDLPW